MISRKILRNAALGALFIAFHTVFSPLAFSHEDNGDLRFIQIEAHSKEDRSALANLGISIEAVRTDSIWAIANTKQIERLTSKGNKVLGNFDVNVARGGHENLFAFPPGDSRFHTYDKLITALKELQTQNPELIALSSIGKTIEGRDIWAAHFNTSEDALKSGQSSKPGAVFMGNHHARERCLQ